jgi:hypothetical protein
MQKRDIDDENSNYNNDDNDDDNDNDSNDDNNDYNDYNDSNHNYDDIENDYHIYVNKDETAEIKYEKYWANLNVCVDGRKTARKELRCFLRLLRNFYEAPTGGMNIYEHVYINIHMYIHIYTYIYIYIYI